MAQEAEVAQLREFVAECLEPPDEFRDIMSDGGKVSLLVELAGLGLRVDKLKEVSVSISSVQYAALKGLAAVWNMSLSHLVRQAVFLHLTDVVYLPDSSPWGAILGELGAVVGPHERDFKQLWHNWPEVLHVAQACRLCGVVAELERTAGSESDGGAMCFSGGRVVRTHLTINISMTETIIDMVKVLVATWCYTSQSEVLRAALNQLLKLVVWPVIVPSLELASWSVIE